MLNYYRANYKTYEDLCWVASRTFMDGHYGRSLTDIELEERKKLEEEYAEEIIEVKPLLKMISDFDKLSMEDKINFAVSLILVVRRQNEKTTEHVKKKNLFPYHSGISIPFVGVEGTMFLLHKKCNGIDTGKTEQNEKQLKR